MRTRTPALIGLLFAVLVALAPSPARADHEDWGIYSIGAVDTWDHEKLNVLVLPPWHGPLFAGPSEVGLANTYLRAVEDSIAAWDAAIETFGSAELRRAFEAEVFVLGRDNVPADVIARPDILITTGEESGLGLGWAARGYPTCVVNNSESWGLASYADIFNIGGQEYGHCLGASHVGGQGGVDPTSDLKHPEHDIMNGFYTHDLGEETHLHCISNLDVLAMDFVFRSPLASPVPVWNRQNADLWIPADDYRTTCAGDGLPADPEHPFPAPDPASSRIVSPADGAEVSLARFDGFTGEKSGAGASRVELSFQRIEGRRCQWWQPRKRSFIARPCEEPLWFAVPADTTWRYLPVGKALAAGTYELRSRASDPHLGALEDQFEKGRNQVSFTLR